MTDSIAFEMRVVATIKQNPRNSRTHSKKQIKQIANSIRAFGFTNPVLLDEHGVLIAGHGRLEAAQTLDLESIPSMVVAGLAERQKRLLLLADNKIALNSGWDREKLSAEIGELMLEDLDLSLTGFEPAEIDQLKIDFEADPSDPADTRPAAPEVPVSALGDLWLLGKHRLLCGDARNRTDLEVLLGTDRAAMAFLDVPYNVRVSDIVGRGSVKHAEFAMASGEMTTAEYRAFLNQSLGLSERFSRDGAVHYVCIDWRHVEDVMAVGREVYQQVLNLVAWVKTNGGQGSFYRSQHELIAVFRAGPSPHLNNVDLGRHGRNRTNVWQYPGVNSFGKGRLDDLRGHPTVKPVAMIVDAIRDCTKRGEVVLDTFAGAGTTMLACERVGRQGRLLEIEPAFVDVAVKRWQHFTRRDAIHAISGLTFDEAASTKATKVA